MTDYQYIAIDIETAAIVPGRLIPALACVQLASRQPIKEIEALAVQLPEAVYKDTRDGIVRYLVTQPLGAQLPLKAVAYVLGNENYRLVYHNAAFDQAVLADASGDLLTVVESIDAGRVHDTQLRELLVALALGQFKLRRSAFDGKLKPTSVNLAELVARYCNEDIREGKTGPSVWRLRYGELIGKPPADWPEAARTYALDDSSWTLRVFEAQARAYPHTHAGHATRDLGDPAFFAGEQREVKAALALHLMAAYGMRTDGRRVHATLAAWRAIAERGREIGKSAGFIRPDRIITRGKNKGKKKRGTKDLKALGALVAQAYTAKGEDIPLTPKGAISCKAEVLRDSDDATLEAYEECMSATRWQSAYAPFLCDGINRPLTYRVRSLLATGRTSISKPPLQQPPREGGMRECFVPRPGYVYSTVDYDAAELGALAQAHIWLGLGNTMAAAINAGQDLHVLMAVDILNAEGHARPSDGGAEPVTGWYYDLAMSCLRGSEGPEWKALAKEYRTLAKAANFGFPGGLGAKTFVSWAKAAYGLRLTLDKAKDLRRLWRARWPEMSGYFAHINRQLEGGETFVTRQFVSHRLRGDCRYTDGANTLFQGLVADGAKEAAWDLMIACYVNTVSPLFGSRPVLFLHDEILVEVPEARAHDAAHEHARIMREAMQRHTPDVKVGAAPALMRAWYKDADTVYSDGVLVPWEPDA